MACRICTKLKTIKKQNKTNYFRIYIFMYWVDKKRRKKKKNKIAAEGGQISSIGTVTVNRKWQVTITLQI